MAGTTGIALGLNIGDDVSLTFSDSLGSTYQDNQLGHLTKLTINLKFKHIEVPTITNGGITLNESKPLGVSAKLTFARMNGALLQVLSAYRQNWFNGIRVSFTIQVLVRNRDGSIDTYLLTGGKPIEGDADFEPGKEVPQNISFEFQNMTINGATATLAAVASIAGATP